MILTTENRQEAILEINLSPDPFARVHDVFGVAGPTKLARQ